MRLLRGLRRPKGRAVVLALDGVPYSFLRALVGQGQLPNIEALLASANLVRMRSVIPTVSCAAWSTFMTGRNPGHHGIFGFTDRRPGTYDPFIPNARDLRGPTLWQLLSDAGRRSVAINLPVTYPPPPLKGLTMVAGFLAPRLEGATHPVSLAARLEQLGYRIDAEARLAREDLGAFLADLNETLAAKARAALHLLTHERWDLFVCHFMATDRINHFLWKQYEETTQPLADEFIAFYRRLDDAVGRIVKHLTDEDGLIVLSDHGFCAVTAEVNLNLYLKSAGLLELDPTLGSGLSAMAPKTRAYSMTPGRIYLNLKGREPRGSVAPSEYGKVRDEVAAALAELRDPETGSPVVERVWRREELFDGSAVDLAPDLVAVPHDGYDLKAAPAGRELVAHGSLSGMHTYGDAFILARGMRLDDRDASILDATPTVLELLGESTPPSFEGRSLLA